ncbi:MAG: hypothetical protein WDA71_13605 [Actinomycetota bacterium]
MGSGLDIALVSGGAALAGTAIGGGLQILLRWQQRKWEKGDRDTARKQEMYVRYLEEVSRLPLTLWEGVTEGSPREVEARLDQVLSRLRIDFMFYGGKTVGQGVRGIREKIAKWVIEGDKAAGADLKRPPEKREGVDAVYRRVFAETVVPAMEHLANLMAKDLDLPGGGFVT